MATARRRATGSARQRAADKPWLSPGCSLSGRSAGILYPLAGRRRIPPVGAPRWRRRDEELPGQQGNTDTDNRWLNPLAALSPAARPASSYPVRRAAEESAGRGARDRDRWRGGKATGSAQGNAALTTAGSDPLAALSPAARPAFFIRWRAARRDCRSGRHNVGDGAAKATGSARQRGAGRPAG